MHNQKISYNLLFLSEGDSFYFKRIFNGKNDYNICLDEFRPSFTGFWPNWYSRIFSESFSIFWFGKIVWWFSSSQTIRWPFIIFKKTNVMTNICLINLTINCSCLLLVITTNILWLVLFDLNGAQVSNITLPFKGLIKFQLLIFAFCFYAVGWRHWRFWRYWQKINSSKKERRTSGFCSSRGKALSVFLPSFLKIKTVSAGSNSILTFS